MINFKKFNSIISLTAYFNSDDKCKQAITEARWGVGNNQDVVCPYCGKHHCKMSKNGRYHCTGCNKNFSCLVGTIFENTKLPLIKWFVGMYLISKIRLLYPQTDDEFFEGTVECDEVYIGGKEKWKHKSMRTPNTQGRSTKTKTPVFGMMERSTIVNADNEEENITYVHAFVVENTNRTTIQPIIQQFVEEGSRVITDELSAYNGLATLGYTHAVVNHGAEEYANGDVYRWNTRKMSESERFAHMFDKSIGLVKKWSEIRVGLVAA